MKYMGAVIPIFLTILIILTGCSEEAPPVHPEKRVVVRKPIKMPAPEKKEAVKPREVEIPLEVKPKPEVKEVQKKESVEVKKEDKKREEAGKDEKGYYLTGKGDTLSAIAGKRDIYGDSFKWPILYRFNRDKLRGMDDNKDFPSREIPEGTRLKIVTPDQAKENLKGRQKGYWVINVLSSPKKERIDPQAVTLIKKGYPAYITLTKVKGKVWMRLRVGFFRQKRDAIEEGKKIMALLHISDVWTTKAGDKEFSEYGGY